MAQRQRSRRRQAVGHRRANRTRPFRLWRPRNNDRYPAGRSFGPARSPAEQITDREAASHLRQGAFVKVVIPDRSYNNVAKLPETVPHPVDIAYAVLNGKLVPRRAEIVARVGKNVLLRQEIGDGELLVTTRSATMTPGLQVQLHKHGLFTRVGKRVDNRWPNGTSGGRKPSRFPATLDEHHQRRQH